jgi:hypothetical protein
MTVSKGVKIANMYCRYVLYVLYLKISWKYLCFTKDFKVNLLSTKVVYHPNKEESV